MKKTLFILLGLFTIVCAQQDSKKSPELLCVVTGEKIYPDMQESSSYKNGKVYFCCGGCKEEYDENSKKYSTKANFQLLATNQYVQTGCPMTGGKIKADKIVAVENTNVSFCCNNCVKKAKKSDDKVSLLFSDASFDKGFTAMNQIKSKKKK